MVRNHRGRGQVSIAYLALLAVAIVLVIVLAVRQVWRSGTKAWVVKDNLKAGERIDATKLVRGSVSGDVVPGSIVTDPAVLIGKTLQRPLEKGAPVTVADITPTPAYKFLSDAPPEGKVVMTVPGNGLGVPLAQLRYGDRLELIASSGEQGRTRVVGHGMIYLGAMMMGGSKDNSLSGQVAAAVGKKKSGGGLAVIVAVDPADVTLITKAEAERNLLTYVLHGRQEITNGRPVEIASHESSGQVELIVGASRSVVK